MLSIYMLQRAVTALNGLQTPANVLKQRTLEVEPRRNPLLEMQDFLERSGIQVTSTGGEGRGGCVGSVLRACGELLVLYFWFQLSDLDRLKAIHVTGTKGKVKG